MGILIAILMAVLMAILMEFFIAILMAIGNRSFDGHFDLDDGFNGMAL